MSFNLAFAISILPRILSTFGTTLWITLVGCVCAALLGFTFESIRRSSKIGRYAMRFLIDFIRSTPVLVQIYFLYFVLPEYGISLPALVIGVMALSLYYSGYLAEVFKAGIDSIPIGQFDAAKAIGLSRFQLVALIVAPQMLRHVAAPMGNYFISLLKATPYLAIIAVPEMLSIALEIASDRFRYTEPMVDVGIIFLLLALCFSGFVKLIESRLAVLPRG